MQGLAWFPKHGFDLMVKEAGNTFPKETGGVLIGYWISHDELVITDIVGPGPKAFHSRYSFIPNSEYQEEKIADLYEKSGRLHTYLGDWHNHTNGKANLSWKDKRTLCRIAKSETARAPNPIMVILAKRDDWVASVWLLRPRSFFNHEFGWKIESCEIKIY